MPETWGLTNLVVQLNWTMKREAKKHFGLSMKTFKTISAIISNNRNDSNINAITFCSSGQQSLHIEWVYTAHLKSTRELSISFPLFKQEIHFIYSWNSSSLQVNVLDFIFWEVKINLSKRHNPTARNKAAAASHGASMPLLAGESRIPQPDESYLPQTSPLLTPTTVWSGVWPIQPCHQLLKLTDLFVSL